MGWDVRVRGCIQEGLMGWRAVWKNVPGAQSADVEVLVDGSSVGGTERQYVNTVQGGERWRSLGEDL